MTFSREPYQVAISKNDAITISERSYYRQRFLHAVFEKIIVKFAERADKNKLTKKKIAQLLMKDAAQLNRTLSLPSNMTLETLSDLALVLGCEPEIFLAEFDTAPRHNYIHPMMEKYFPAKTLDFNVQNTTENKDVISVWPTAKSRNSQKIKLQPKQLVEHA